MLHIHQITMMPSEFNWEAFELYRKYQMAVHNEPYAKITEHSYKTFLCDTPLVSSVPTNNPSLVFFCILLILYFFYPL